MTTFVSYRQQLRESALTHRQACPERSRRDGFHLHPYQEEAVEKTWTAWQEGRHSVLVSLPTGTDGTMDGMTRRALRDAVLKALDAEDSASMQRAEEIGLEWILANIPGAERAFNQIASYWQRLHLVRGSSRSTTVEVLETYIEKAREDGYQDIVLFVDYSQKVPYRPPIGAPEPDTTQRIGHVVSGLKDVALGTGVPIVAVAASDEAGLRSGKVRLADLLGPSLVQYECDVGIIQNPHDVGIEGRQTVLWTIEKNRSGPTDVGLVFELHGEFFYFDPQGAPVALHEQDESKENVGEKHDE